MQHTYIVRDAVFNVTFNNKGSLRKRAGKKRSQHKEEVAAQRRISIRVRYCMHAENKLRQME